MTATPVVPGSWSNGGRTNVGALQADALTSVLVSNCCEIHEGEIPCFQDLQPNAKVRQIRADVGAIFAK